MRVRKVHVSSNWSNYISDRVLFSDKTNSLSSISMTKKEDCYRCTQFELRPIRIITKQKCVISFPNLDRITSPSSPFSSLSLIRTYFLLLTRRSHSLTHLAFSLSRAHIPDWIERILRWISVRCATRVIGATNFIRQYWPGNFHWFEYLNRNIFFTWALYHSLSLSLSNIPFCLVQVHYSHRAFSSSIHTRARTHYVISWKSFSN